MLRCLIPTLSVSTAAFCGALNAQEFPTRPLRIVTAAVGGASDLVARLIAQGLTASFGQQAIVDNRPSGIIPGEIVVAAPPDGYTLLFHGSSLWMMQPGRGAPRGGGEDDQRSDRAGKSQTWLAELRIGSKRGLIAPRG